MTSRTRHLVGHIYALICAFVWGITFISSKKLLVYFTPLSIMVIRFTLAYFSLWIIHPKFVKPVSYREEFVYFSAGLTGVVGYFLMENTALIYTTVSNVGLILAAAPLLVAIVGHIFLKDEPFHLNVLYGFVIAMVGVGLVIFNGQLNLKVNPLGDFLALMAALVWAFYSLTIKKMDTKKPTVFHTRRTFFYGVIIGYIVLFAREGGFDITKLTYEHVWFHMGLLGFLGSALCFVLWGTAIGYIGANKTSSYIYLMPLFTMLASALILDEIITVLMIVGCVFILFGVFISEYGFKGLGKVKKLM